MARQWRNRPAPPVRSGGAFLIPLGSHPVDLACHEESDVQGNLPERVRAGHQEITQGEDASPETSPGCENGDG